MQSFRAGRRGIAIVPKERRERRELLPPAAGCGFSLLAAATSPNEPLSFGGGRRGIAGIPLESIVISSGARNRRHAGRGLGLSFGTIAIPRPPARNDEVSLSWRQLAARSSQPAAGGNSSQRAAAARGRRRQFAPFPPLYSDLCDFRSTPTAKMNMRQLKALLGLALFASACQRDAGAVQRGAAGSTAATASTVPSATGAPASSVKTWTREADPCGWITAAEAAKLLGPLAGAPWRATHAESPEPSAKGFACGYTLAAPNGGQPGADRVAVELVTEDVTTTESAYGMMAESATRAGGPMKDAVEWLGLGNKPLPGWDFTSGLPNQFTARIGALAVKVGIYTTRVPGDSIVRLATLVRDRVPDLPMASPEAANRFGPSDERDACILITRAEAEAVLGPLAMPPYRSDHDSPNADPGGAGCSYYLGNHRVFTIDPTWEQGKILFRMAAGMGQKITSVLGSKGESADTLDGTWDQATAGADGTLYFLKGDSMLTVSYRTAAIDAPKAVRLATIAVGRLTGGR